MQVFRIKEFGKIMSSEDFKYINSNDSEIIINPSAFDSIWSYILEFQSTDRVIEKAFKLLTINGKRQIQVQNYVGTIETYNKTVIEILPKIFSNQGEIAVDRSKEIFFKLVASSKNIPSITFQHAALETVQNFPILETFIYNYVSEVEQLVLRGLKKDYTPVEKNSKFLKGQLLFSKDILKNLVDKSNFFIRNTIYHVDIPQNRIIKSTLIKLHNITISRRNEIKIKHLLLALSDIDHSKDVCLDLAKSKYHNRLFLAYEKAILWSEIFLLNKGFTSFSGKTINQAILFPMERLFEDFVKEQFRRYAPNHSIHVQDSRHNLIEDHDGKKKFKLKPDLYLMPKDNNAMHVVLDTKWKLLNDRLSNKNYLISQSDMYQAYAYGKKYSKENKNIKLYLVYPMNDSFKTKLKPFVYDLELDNKLELIIVPFDLTGGYQNQVLTLLRKPSVFC